MTSLDKENVAPAHDKRKPSSCVFVASLRASLSDDALCRSVTAHFLPYGALLSVKVLRDSSNRPYAFVQYSNDAACRRAIEAAHDSVLEGRRIRCEAAKVNRTLFLSAPVPVTAADVRRLAAAYGDTELITASDINGNILVEANAGASFCWFVKFSYRDDAINAFASLSEEGKFHVEWTQNIDDNYSMDTYLDKRLVYVGQLNPAATKHDIYTHFAAHGEIDDVDLVQGASSVFAFVRYKTVAAAALAVSRDNHAMFMDTTIHVRYRQLRAPSTARVIYPNRVPMALAPSPLSYRTPGPTLRKPPAPLRPKPNSHVSDDGFTVVGRRRGAAAMLQGTQLRDYRRAVGTPRADGERGVQISDAEDVRPFVPLPSAASSNATRYFFIPGAK